MLFEQTHLARTESLQAQSQKSCASYIFVAELNLGAGPPVRVSDCRRAPWPFKLRPGRRSSLSRRPARNLTLIKKTYSISVEGVSIQLSGGDCFASLAMTGQSVFARSEIQRSAGKQSQLGRS